MNRTSLRSVATLVAALLAAAATPGCASSNTASEQGGSCTTATSCWMITVPASANVRDLCALAGGTHATTPCPTTGYARRCTQVTRSSSSGQETEQTWVYHFKAGDETKCLGTDEPLATN